MMPRPSTVLLFSATALLLATGSAAAQTGSPGTIVRCWDSFTQQIRTKIAQDVQSSLTSGSARNFSSDRPVAALGLPDCLLVR